MGNVWHLLLEKRLEADFIITLENQKGKMEKLELLLYAIWEKQEKKLKKRKKSWIRI